MTAVGGAGEEKGTRMLMYRDALNEALKEEMRRDPTVFCMGEGIAERGGSYKVTDGLLEEFGGQRVFDELCSSIGDGLEEFDHRSAALRTTRR